MRVLESGFFSQVEVVGVGRHGTSGQRHVDGVPEGVRVEPRQERHGRVVRSWVTVTAEADVVLEHVSSFAMTGVAAALGAAADWEHRISRIGTGTADGGHGLLGHNRSWLAWVGRVLDRHPGLVIEACAAGGMRTDGATLAQHSVMSVTDQQDAVLLPPIAAAVPAAVPPEQSAMWACPQGSDEAITFSMVTAMLGRIHLSGRLDLLDDHQLGLVAAALAVYRSYRRDLARGVPRWPLGLPRWDAGQLALAIDCGDVAYLALWRRGTAESAIRVPWPESVRVDPLFPAGARARWEAGSVRAALGEADTACLLRLTPTPTTLDPEGPTWREG